MDYLHQLRVFTSVYKNRSFSRASEELALSQPTVSDHIMNLEEKLDCKLFDRLGRAIFPTREAEVLYNHAIGIIEQINTMEDTFNHLKKEISEKLVVGASTIPGTYLMPQIISEFKKIHPDISFKTDIGVAKEIFEKILKHHLFVGVVDAKLNDSRLVFTPVMEVDYIVVSSPSLIKKDVLSLEELAEVPVVCREEDSDTKKETQKILEDKGFNPENLKIVGTFNSTDAIKQAVKEGVGIASLPRFSVAEELKHKTLKEIRVSDVQCMKRNVYLVTHHKRTLPFAYKTFTEYITAYM